MKSSDTLKLMAFFCVFLLVVSLICLGLYSTHHQSWMFSAFIMLLITFYHFAMRLLVGDVITFIYKNRTFNMNSFAFRLRRYENTLYQILRVKMWKSKVITAKPEQFDIRKVDISKLLHNVLQAELVHRTIMVLSFLPLLLIIPFGFPVVFVLTSVLACLIDSIFVIIQRFNRPRIIKLLRTH